MKVFLVLWTALVAAGWACAQEKAAPAAAPVPVAPVGKGEIYLLQPEPRALREPHSVSLGGARETVFTPARRVEGKPGLQTYNKAEFAKLGISADTFAERARTAADKILAALQPELIKDDAGRVRYAVYRGEDPIYASLIVAPSLAKVFTNIFGKEIWAAAPDRHALYIFPPNPAIVNDFAADLADRFDSDPNKASEEVFIINAAGEMKAAGTVKDR